MVPVARVRLSRARPQLIQVPLIAVGRLPVIKRNKLMGNVVFWLGLYAGFPLLCVAYCAY
jgi:sterol O-acyltransferase